MSQLIQTPRRDRLRALRHLLFKRLKGVAERITKVGGRSRTTAETRGGSQKNVYTAVLAGIENTGDQFDLYGSVQNALATNNIEIDKWGIAVVPVGREHLLLGHEDIS